MKTFVTDLAAKSSPQGQFSAVIAGRCLS